MSTICSPLMSGNRLPQTVLATVVALPPSMRRCWIRAYGDDVRATRDFATVAMLLGRGLRRHCDQEDGGAAVGLANLFSSIGMDCCICSI